MRSEALRCRLRLSGLAAADDHALDVVFQFSVIALDHHAERQMLAETFLSDKSIATTDDVSAHFFAPLGDAVARIVKTHPAQHWTTDPAKETLIASMREASNPVAFASGIDVVGPFEIAIESQTLHREQIETMQRRLVQKRAEGQAQHVATASKLLKQFQSLRDSAPALSPGQILDRVAPADRGSMLETLLLAASGETTALLWAVAGSQLLKMNPRKFPMHADAIALPQELGPARSVQPAGAGELLIGAQTGVILIGTDNAGSYERFRDPAVTSQLGFNSAAQIGSMIWASHSEAGVVAWQIDQRDEPIITLRTPNAKNLVPLDDDRALFSAAGEAFIVSQGGESRWIESATGAPITFITADGATITLVRDDGTVQIIDATSLALISSTRRAGALTAAATLPWLGTTRLLLATADGPVNCIGADDSLTTQYVSAHRGLRSLAATADTIAGISADRQRIVLWKSWDARQPAAEMHIAAIARHRAADICFA